MIFKVHTENTTVFSFWSLDPMFSCVGHEKKKAIGFNKANTEAEMASKKTLVFTIGCFIPKIRITLILTFISTVAFSRMLHGICPCRVKGTDTKTLARLIFFLMI